MLVATCPSHEELLDYAVGRLSDEAADALAGHLDSCENCQADLAALPDAEDTLVARLRGPLPPDPILDEPECSRAVARARAIAESEASATNLPRLLGEYQLSAKLGSGGMGTVYKALHTKLGRVVALKVLTRARTHDPAAVARFEREMQAVGQLDHRHIVRAHDAREIDGTPILVMEYLDGLDLGEIVRRVGAGVPALAGNLPSPAGRGAGGEGGGSSAAGIPIPDAAELARQTAVGLQTIYEHGLVHRDIKPSNLMLTADGEVKILDLGLARLRPDVPPGEEMTATGQGMGTADYMAPEQASDSRAVDIRADIYSLGCTLYKLLTGRAPFSGPEYRTAFDKMTAHVQALPPPVRGVAPGVPEGLSAIVSRMLAKNPADRFATPAELADTLGPHCGGANLPALLARAKASPPRPPGDGRGDGGSGLPSPSERGARGEGRNLPSPSGRGAGGEGRRWKRFAGQLLLLALVGGLGIALGIIIRIHKDGKTTTVKLADGSDADVSSDGDIDVKLPGAGVPALAGDRQLPPKGGTPTPAAETPPWRFGMATVTRGDLTATISALGTIEPEEVVDVAAQVEGPIVKFGDDPRGKADPSYKGKPVDYNSPVETGTVLAEIDPTLYKARRDQAAADLNRAKAQLALAEAQLAQAKTGQAPFGPAEAAVVAAQAALAQSKAALELAQINLDRTVIRSPVKGVIVDRRVNIGQNVGPKPGTAGLFLIAKDLEKLQIWVSVNESDIAQIAKGMDVRFTVDTLRGEAFRGNVAQIRLNATMTQNVVTYTVVVVVDKPDKRLMPYMTANVSFLVETRRNVLLVPNAALRYKPRRAQIVPWVRVDVSKFRSGWLWVLAEDGKHLRPVKVEVELTDGTMSVVTGVDVKEGKEVVTGELVGDAQSNPYVPKPFAASGQSGKATSEGTPAAAPLPTVRVTQPVVCDVCDYEEYTGRIQVGHVEFALPALGVLEKACVQESAMVREDDPLAEVVTTSNPKVAEALEAVRLASPRGRGGRGVGSGSDIAQRQSELKAAEEKLESAMLAAPKTKVVAPISGRLVYFDTPQSLAGGRGAGGRAGTPHVFGSIELAIGPRAGRNRMHVSLCMIESTDSMVLAFDVPERTVLEHRRNANRKPGWEFSLPVVFGLADDKGFPYRGKVVSVAEGINPETHTQRWEAVVPNKDGIFLSGMSVRVRLITSEPHKLMLVPNSISIHEFTPFNEDLVNAEVDIVNKRDVIEARKVTMGRNYNYDGFISIQAGLDVTDWVVIGRNGRLNAGKTVKPDRITTPPPPWAAISVPPSVTVAHPIIREVTDYQDFTGHLEASQTAEIRARASGNLNKVCFKPGMSVKKGDVLFEIDPRLYQAELDQAAGAVKQAQIRLNARTQDVKRVEMLLKTAAISQEEFDKVKNDRDEAQAAVQTAQAALYVAQVRLDYTRITAPFAGRIGRSSLDAGNLVTADKTVLATLASTDPMYVYFDVDERTMLTILRTGNDRALSLPVSFGLPDEQGFPHRGKMDAADSRIDPATGTARWRAVLSNKDGMLSPGMFVRVRLAISAPHRAIVVPKSAIANEGPPLHDIVRWYVFTVNDQNVVERRDVEPHAVTDDDRSVYVKGLSVDDLVIASPVYPLKPGMTVTPEKAAPETK